MRRDQIKRVQASLAILEPCGPALAARVLQRLSCSDPHARAFFGEVSEHRTRKLYATLKQIVEHLDVFAELERPLMGLGTKAFAVGVRPPHLSSVRRELLASVREISGDAWTEELERDWIDAGNAVIGVMLRGYANTLRNAA